MFDIILKVHKQVKEITQDKGCIVNLGILNYNIYLEVRWYQFSKSYGYRHTFNNYELLDDTKLSYILEHILKQVRYEVGKNEYEYGTLA